MTQATTPQALKQLSLGLALLGLCFGFLSAYGVLAGDAEGRVNLLFMLLLFAFLPFIGLLLSLFLLLKGGGKGLAGWILDVPMWPRHLSLALPQLELSGGRESWLFYQTQILAVWFSAGCLLLYLLLLFGSDITFVWRSTLLEAGDLLPALQVLGAPWRFWPEAQASLSLIEQTQDFRAVAQANSQPTTVGLWWKYILAAQLSYNLIPRSIMLLVARNKYHAHLEDNSSRHAEPEQQLDPEQYDAELTLADLSTTVSLPYTLLDWVGAPAPIHQQLQQQLGTATGIHRLSPLSSQQDIHWSDADAVVVLVKSWEPPMAELADRLAELDSKGGKWIAPLDWNDNGVQPPSTSHLDEWRRFTATLPDWQVVKTEPSA